MSQVYVMSVPTDTIKTKLQAGELPGLSLLHKPMDGQGQPSLWPYAVSDGHNFGWFEGDFILFWGAADPTRILQTLNHSGIRIVDSF